MEIADIRWNLELCDVMSVWMANDCNDGASAEAIGESIERGSYYTEAGADGFFIPDMGDLDQKLVGSNFWAPSANQCA
jgi:hypothetical protein